MDQHVKKVIPHGIRSAMQFILGQRKGPGSIPGNVPKSCINTRMKLKDIIETKAMTIRAASHGTAGIDRDQAEYITDPRGIFAKNRRKLKRKENNKP